MANLILTPDNLQYHITVKESEDLNIILPELSPSKVLNNGGIIVNACNAIKIKLYIDVQDEEAIPALDIISDSNISYVGGIEIEGVTLTQGMNIITISTVDGGNNYYIEYIAEHGSCEVVIANFSYVGDNIRCDKSIEELYNADFVLGKFEGTLFECVEKQSDYIKFENKKIDPSVGDKTTYLLNWNEITLAIDYETETEKAHYQGKFFELTNAN